MEPSALVTLVRLVGGSRATALVLAMAAVFPAAAQQLEPRAYSPAPVGANFAGVSYTNSHGDVLFDPTLPFSDVSAKVNLIAPFYARTFGFLGRSASVGVVLPYAWGSVEGNVGEEYRRADRSGLADAALRLATNLAGGPALSPREFAARRPSTTLGASLTIAAPTGQYDGSKLINIGANRWSFKPELGLSCPVGKWWLEAQAGIWLFTSNHDFFGGQVREQSPLAIGQAHAVYTFKPRLWVALGLTYYSGGETTLDGVRKADRQENSRAGVTLALPVGRAQSLKLAYTRGTTARIGTKLDTLAIAWQVLWFDRSATSPR